MASVEVDNEALSLASGAGDDKIDGSSKDKRKDKSENGVNDNNNNNNNNDGGTDGNGSAGQAKDDEAIAGNIAYQEQQKQQQQHQYASSMNKAQLSVIGTDTKIQDLSKDASKDNGIRKATKLGQRQSLQQEQVPQMTTATLPPEVLRKIFYSLDPESFASGSLVCRSWREASNDPKLYAYQLSQIPTISPYGTAAANALHLPRLKRTLASEVKRCLYLPFLRPKITTVSLVAEAPLSSFAAGPGGEKFEFTFSHSARWCLAITSSRIYIMNLNEEINVTKELKVLRRPLAADILSDGSVMAVLSSDHSVSLYSITNEKAELRKSVELDNIPYTIAMSPGGEILAAAFEGGLELCSLQDGPSPSQRRTVKTHRVDKLMFSRDGSMLLGTTQQGRDPATVILTAPYFSAVEFDMTPSELVNNMWTQQILFPSSSRDCSHSTLLPRDGDQDSNWTLTYDRTYESFRAVRTDDLRNGTTYFTGPENGSDRRVWPKDALVPSSLPSANTKGDLVAAGFNGSEIWLYGVPDDLDAVPTLQSPIEGGVVVEAADPTGESTEGVPAASSTTDGPPKWQMLVDKYRNVFSKGKKVADVSGIASMCWHDSEASPTSDKKSAARLIVAAPGGVGSDMSLDEIAPKDGGRLVIFDFGVHPRSGEQLEKTIELGIQDPQLLEEHKADFQTEVARARRRTMAQRDSARVRSVLDALRPENALEDVPEIPTIPDFNNATTTISPGQHTNNVDVSDDDEPGITVEEAAAFAEGPYSLANPRSRSALYRSATVNQASRQRAQRSRVQQPVQATLRRQDGTEIPDESDADNWVPPPPPYQRHADELLPDDLVQRALLYNGIAPLPSTAESMVRPRRSSSLHDASSQRRRSSVDVDLIAAQLRRPVRQPSDMSIGDASSVSSVSVTPRSSIRRRPLTVYQSSSSALRDSGLRDSLASRSGSNFGSSSARMSRSESLRHSLPSGSTDPGTAGIPSITGTGPAASSVSSAAAHSVIHDQTDSPNFPSPAEEVGSISPERVSLADLAISDRDVDFGDPSPDSNILVPEGRQTDTQENEQLPEAVLSSDNAADSGPLRGRSTVPRSEIDSSMALPVTSDSSTVPIPDTVDASASEPARQQLRTARTELHPDHQNVQNSIESSLHSQTHVPNVSHGMQPIWSPEYPNDLYSSRNVERAPLRVSPPISPLQTEEFASQELEANPIARRLATADSTLVTTAAAAVAEPTITQEMPTPSNQPYAQVQALPDVSTQPQPRLASTDTGFSGAVELPDNVRRSKSKSDRSGRRLSQRLRGAFRRNDQDSVPELPQVPQHHVLAQTSSPAGPAHRHSQMYAELRNNASEPVLRARPGVQRMNGVESSASQISIASPSGRVLDPSRTGDIPIPQDRPQPKRTRSIFGRRKSRDVTRVFPDRGDVPPLPNMPSLPPHVTRGNNSNMRNDYGAAPTPAPTGLRRAVTDHSLQQPLHQHVGQQQQLYNHGPQGESTTWANQGNVLPLQDHYGQQQQGKRRKGKDKDAKCIVM